MYYTHNRDIQKQDQAIPQSLVVTEDSPPAPKKVTSYEKLR